MHISAEMLTDYKEQIIRAVTKSQVAKGINEEGKIIYRTVAKDEAVERVVNLFDHVAFEFEQLRTSGIALEKILYEMCPDLSKNDILPRYIEIVEEERLKSTYRTEVEKEVERDILRERFKVIDGEKE